MTPKEKATELIIKFKSNVYKKAFADTNFMYDRYYGLDNEMAKQCALIAVDEILEQMVYMWLHYANLEKQTKEMQQYWNKVKQEIEAL